jgi:hypothetical protein
MTQYAEGELRYPALELLSKAPGGLTTTQLIAQLTEVMRPDGHDIELLANRRDNHFSQTVRNLTGSHHALEREGYVEKSRSRGPIKLTASGTRALDEARRSGEWSGLPLQMDETTARNEMWAKLLAAGGPDGVSPAVLAELRIYRRARAVWMDRDETARRDPDGLPVAVAVLHTGSIHQEALTEDGLIFFYPTTERPGRDASEVVAIKRAGTRQVPVFVVTRSPNPDLRDVRKAYVVGYDDDLGQFDLTFTDEPVEVAPKPDKRKSIGLAKYRRANEHPATTPREPFAVDPDEVDRSLGAHNATQNALADWLQQAGCVPHSSPIRSASFDLAWEWPDSGLGVAEVKSLNDRNEAKQLRLGLGQILHYHSMLEAEGDRVDAVLAVEREPRDTAWLALCERHGVILVWPGCFDRITRQPIQEGSPAA